MSENKAVNLDLHDSTVGDFQEQNDFSELLEALMVNITWAVERQSIPAPKSGFAQMTIGNQVITLNYDTVINSYVGPGLDQHPRRFLTTDLSRAAQYDMALDEMDGFVATCMGLRKHEDQGLIWRDKPRLSRVLCEKGMFVMIRARLVWI